MSVEAFYREPDKELCQGDVVYDIPHFGLTEPPLHVLREEPTSSKTPFYSSYEFRPDDLYDRDAPPDGFRFDEGEQVAALCQVGLGLVLSHGCDIDKELNPTRLVAAIFPLDALSDEDQVGTKRGQLYHHLYLPAYSDMPDSFADFRRISSISREYLEHMRRVASLGTIGLARFQFQFLRFFTRLEMTDEAKRLADEHITTEKAKAAKRAKKAISD